MTTQLGYGDPQTWSGLNPYDENTDGFQAYINAAQDELIPDDLWKFLSNDDWMPCGILEGEICKMILDKKADKDLIYNQLCRAITDMTTKRARQLEDAHILQQANDFEVKDDY